MSEVRTQAELDAAIKRGDPYIDLRGDGAFTVRACGSSTVTAYDSSTVTAYGSSTVRAYGSSTVTAYGSSTVTAYGSSTVRAYGSSTVTAYGSSTVRAYGSSTVRACGSSTVTAYGSSTVTASALVPVQDHGPDTKITATVVIPIRTPETMEQWCEFYGVKVARGWVVVFKATNAGGMSDHGFLYPIGEEVKAPDWVDTKACGNGLHFSPRPFMALTYAPTAVRFLACRVKVSECVVLGDKIKAPRCKVVGDVNEDGEAVSRG